MASQDMSCADGRHDRPQPEVRGVELANRCSRLCSGDHREGPGQLVAAQAG